MPLVTLTFNDPINSSVQIGDTVYYIPTNTPGTSTDAFETAQFNNAIELGPIQAITNQYGIGGAITLTVFTNVTTAPADGDYIMFGKNNVVNTSGIVGYYAKVKLKNDSKDKVELFSISSEIFESSK